MTEYSINYDANTIAEAKQYLQYRYKQMLKSGYTLQNEFVVEENTVVSLYNAPTGTVNYGSVYILKDSRGKGLLEKRVQEFNINILTSEECGISAYLESRKIDHLTLIHSDAYKLIQKEYGDQRAKRSGVPLIYHIDEGGAILHKIGASDTVKDAYYLHPLLQSDECLLKNKSVNFGQISTESIILAMEYRRVANSYLSMNKKSDFVGFSTEEVKQMLIADKIQNYKDFMAYHFGTHPRSNQLQEYFMNWFDLLGVNYADWETFNYG